MIYLDNAATTWPKPPAVERAFQLALKKFGANPGRSGHSFSIATAQEIYKCRETTASFFNAKGPECVVFTLNCTCALNMALKGVLRPGDHVITSNIEHNAVIRPLQALALKGVTVDFAPVSLSGNDKDTVGAFKSLINKKTKMIVCTHASNVWGIKLPIESIGALAKKYGLYFTVDAAQSAGVVPIDIKAMNIDFLCCAGHKGLYGPMGTGILILNNGEMLSTIIEGGTGSNSLSPFQPNIMPDRFESGTVNTCGILALKAAIDYIKKIGLDRIYKTEISLIQYLYENLSQLKGVILYTARPERGAFVPMLSFNIEGLKSTDTASLLDLQGIAVRAGLHCAPAAHVAMGTQEIGAVRVCPSIYTTKKEINILLHSISKITKKIPRVKN